MQELQDLMFAAAPGIGAVLLSLYNWIKMPRGSKITAFPIVNYGIWSKKYQEKKSKILLLPVILNNNGIKAGMVKLISISFKGSNGEKEVQIRRRVKLNLPTPQQLRSMDSNTFRETALIEINPFFPITVNPGDETMVMLDCFDLDAIILDEKLTCTINIYQDMDKPRSISFPFMLTEKDFEEAQDHVKWYRA